MSNATQEIKLTKDEAAIVKTLIELYETETTMRHGRTCGCDICEAVGAVDNSNSQDFNSLLEKVTP